MFSTKQFLAAVALLLCATTSYGAFDLNITEIWPGNEPGSGLTSDWFEITNVGDTAWLDANDGSLWYDDDSADPSTADLLMGIASIAAGESVVFVDGFDVNTGSTANVDEFLSAWDPVKPQGQVGWFEGAGLSQGGDAVSVWISADAPTGSPDLVQAYPDAEFNGGQSFDVLLDAFSVDGNASGAVTTIAVNDMGQPGIGSPGMIVPEPSSSALVLTCLAVMAWRRR